VSGRNDEVIVKSSATRATPLLLWHERDANAADWDLMPYSPGDTEVQARVRAFREELRRKSWASGINVRSDERWTLDSTDFLVGPIARLRT